MRRIHNKFRTCPRPQTFAVFAAFAMGMAGALTT
jgi:hypothetical protein